MSFDIVVLVSGRGSNLQALCEAAENSSCGYRVVAVVSDNAKSYGLARAKAFKLPTHVIANEEELTNIAKNYKPDLLCLAGFMRILSAQFVAQWESKIINIHPSLLPRHKGLDTHRRALAAGDEWHGASVHYVDAEIDGGEIIEQIKVAILPDDTPESLADRVLDKEHILYPRVVARLAQQNQSKPTNCLQSQSL